MKFYIASKLANREQVSWLAVALKAAGHTQTYDWAAHCSDDDEDVGEARLRAVAAGEAGGVLQADFVIVVLPGGRGTHAELGIAIGAGGKQIIICSPADSPFKGDGDTCAFYWHPGVSHISGDAAGWPAAILALAAKWEATQ